MGSRRAITLRLAVAVGVAAAIGVPNALASSSPAPSGGQTYPNVTPRTGGRHRTFKLSFTLAQAPGHSGYEYTEYRAVVSAPAHTRASCTPTQPAPVTSGTQGEVERIALHQPTHGWCKGRYAVTVYLQRTQTCPPPVQPGPSPHIICPLTPGEAQPVAPVGDVDTGQTHFTVR
ncbi:MAG TPA: hypothetical protein VGI50_13015 [Solirubrobacteraceae bacterium]|jgi:hypothetical protein